MGPTWPESTNQACKHVVSGHSKRLLQIATSSPREMCGPTMPRGALVRYLVRYYLHPAPCGLSPYGHRCCITCTIIYLALINYSVIWLFISKLVKYCDNYEKRLERLGIIYSDFGYFFFVIWNLIGCRS